MKTLIAYLLEGLATCLDKISNMVRKPPCKHLELCRITKTDWTGVYGECAKCHKEVKL